MAYAFPQARRLLAGFGASIALVLALSACGSDSEASTTQGLMAMDSGPVQEVRLAMGDFFYEPKEITLEPGNVRFLLTNVGNTAHRFAITGEGVKVSTRNVGAGREGVMEIALRPGTYKMGCTLGDHEARGSVGQIIVQ